MSRLGAGTIISDDDPGDHHLDPLESSVGRPWRFGSGVCRVGLGGNLRETRFLARSCAVLLPLVAGRHPALDPHLRFRSQTELDNFSVAWLGGIFLAGDMAMFFCAVKLTSVVDVTVIGAVQPAFVLVARGPLFGERMGRWDVIWILVAMAGVSAAVVGPGVISHHELSGDLLAVGSMLSWSAYWLVSKHARSTENALEYTAVVTIVAAIA